MLRKSPCEVYLKFLLSHPDKKDIPTIRALVRAQQLDYPSDHYAEALRRGMAIPSPFKPYDRLNKKSFNFLIRHQLVGFYFPDEDAAMAHTFLETPRVKELIETMTIARNSSIEIVQRLRKTGTAATLGSITRYCQYYWQLDNVDDTELRALIEMRYLYIEHKEGTAEISPQDLLQRDAMKKARYNDPRVVLMNIAVAPVAAMMNQLRLGIMPNNLELSKIVSAVRIASIGRTLEAVVANSSPNNALMAKEYASVSKLMSELLTDLGDPGAELQAQLQQLALQTDATIVPQLSELSQGNHTTDKGPKLVDGRPVNQLGGVRVKQ